MTDQASQAPEDKSDYARGWNPQSAGRGLPAWIDHGARRGRGSNTAAGGECVPALVLDGEHGVLGLIGQSKPAPLSLSNLL